MDCGNDKSADIPDAGHISSDGIITNTIVAEKGSLTAFTSAGDSVKTLYDSFRYGVQRNPSADCLGKRKDINSPYVFKSYATIEKEAKALGAYMSSALKISPNDRVGMSGKNAPEYLTAINGCYFAGITTVPIYDTFGEPECKFIIDQAQVKAIFVSAANAEKLASWCGSGGTVKKLIVWGTDESFVATDLMITYEEALKEGTSTSETVEATPPAPSDLAIIMYTSGTTGKPKGVMLPHTALVATLASTEQYFRDYGYPVDKNDIFMSYLPLAHVFDFFSENLFLFLGSKIGYYRGDQKTLVDDIGELKPTVFVGVPRVFDKIYKRVSGMIEEGSGLKRFLFNTFYDQKKKNMSKGVPYDKASFLGDKLVFSKVKARLGGRVRIICSGGAPLAQHVEEFLRVTMCCPVVQGYGLTETCAASCVAMPGAPSQLGTVGPPLFSLELKLDPVESMGYDGTATGGGEICFRGPSVMKGYYLNPEETKKVLEDDGWFHTGDIGKIVAGGCLKIVDRKKQLFKLSQGEYVSPEKVEGVSGKSALVSQIFVHGTSTEASLIAVVVPSESALNQHDISSPGLKTAILKDLDKVCRGEGLKGYEVPKGVILYAEEFTPESGFVTPSFKLKRPFLRKHFEEEINKVYAELNAK